MLNSSKTQCIFIGSKQLCSHIPEDVIVQFDGTSISPSTHIKNLVLHMDRYLTFETLISEISKKVMAMLISVESLISEISKKVMAMLIYIYRISSYLDKTMNCGNPVTSSQPHKVLHKYLGHSKLCPHQ